jgi:hypothetical protein
VKIFSYLTAGKTGHGYYFLRLFADKPVLPAVVYPDNFVPQAYKVFGVKLAVNIMQKNNARREWQAGIAEFKRHIFPPGNQEPLEGDHLPPQMGFYFFMMAYNGKIFKVRNIFGVLGNDNGNFICPAYLIQPDGNLTGVALYAGKPPAKKIAVNQDFFHTG